MSVGAAVKGFDWFSLFTALVLLGIAMMLGYSSGVKFRKAELAAAAARIECLEERLLLYEGVFGGTHHCKVERISEMFYD